MKPPPTMCPVSLLRASAFPHPLTPVQADLGTPWELSMLESLSVFLETRDLASPDPTDL